jgi:hypothetical protein
MSIARLLATAALALPAAAFAANSLNVATSSCSGSLASSFDGGVSLVCTGDLFLGQGSIFSDADILLSATGTLQLTEIALTGHTVTLNAGTQLAIDAESILRTTDAGAYAPLVPATNQAIVHAGGLELRQSPQRDVIQWETFDIGTGGAVHFQQPGTIQPSLVPEPASMGLMLAGLTALGVRSRRRV